MSTKSVIKSLHFTAIGQKVKIDVFLFDLIKQMLFMSLFVLGLGKLIIIFHS
jgi:hypothetical protein